MKGRITDSEWKRFVFSWFISVTVCGLSFDLIKVGYFFTLLCVIVLHVRRQQASLCTKIKAVVSDEWYQTATTLNFCSHEVTGTWGIRDRWGVICVWPFTAILSSWCSSAAGSWFQQTEKCVDYSVLMRKCVSFIVFLWIHIKKSSQQ